MLNPSLWDKVDQPTEKVKNLAPLLRKQKIDENLFAHPTELRSYIHEQIAVKTKKLLSHHISEWCMYRKSLLVE